MGLLFSQRSRNSSTVLGELSKPCRKAITPLLSLLDKPARSWPDLGSPSLISLMRLPGLGKRNGAEPVDTNSLAPNSLPLCRDPHDQKFLILTEAGNAEVLVTGDQGLLELSGQTSFEIEAPDSFKKRLKWLDTE
jgi:PIN domain